MIVLVDSIPEYISPVIVVALDVIVQVLLLFHFYFFIELFNSGWNI